MANLLTLWTLGMFILWLRTHCYSPSTPWTRGQPPRTIVATLELARAIEKELDIDYVDPQLVDEKCLERRIEKEVNGGSILFASEYLVSEDYRFGKALRDMLVEKWRATSSNNNRWCIWLVCICMAVLSILWSIQFPDNTAPSFGLLMFWIVLLGVAVGCLFALRIGTSLGSRLLIISTVVLFSLIFFIPARSAASKNT